MSSRPDGTSCRLRYEIRRLRHDRDDLRRELGDLRRDFEEVSDTLKVALAVLQCKGVVHREIWASCWPERDPAAEPAIARPRLVVVPGSKAG